jgi:MoxR-like ATPase
MRDLQSGFVANEVYKVEQFGNTFKLIDIQGNKVGTNGVSTSTRKGAFGEGKALQAFVNKSGKKTFRKVDIDVYNSLVVPMTTQNGGVQFENNFDHQAIKDFIHQSSVGLKPRELVITDLKWKYLIRSAVRAKNIMMTGPAGCGKTMAAKAAANSLEGYKTFIINLGATQDPRTTLIGNTQFDTKKGTVFNTSPFVKAIQTPNTVIVLDELTRAHPEAHNILMSVLDQGQRYLRLDEAADAPVVKVADGVSFIASANIGNEYTATRALDRAILDRFTIIEMDTLTKAEEATLLQMMYPSVLSETLTNVAEITSMTRTEVMSESPKLSNSLSTRTAVEIGSLLYDGFSLAEAAEITIYPLFDQSGGAQSERVYMKQYIQKFLGERPSDENLFNVETDDITNPF